MTHKNTTQKNKHKKIRHEKCNMKNTTKKLYFLSFFLSIPSGWCYIWLIGKVYSGAHSVNFWSLQHCIEFQALTSI